MVTASGGIARPSGGRLTPNAIPVSLSIGPWYCASPSPHRACLLRSPPQPACASQPGSFALSARRHCSLDLQHFLRPLRPRPLDLRSSSEAPGFFR